MYDNGNMLVCTNVCIFVSICLLLCSQMLSFGNYLSINSSSYVHLCCCSSHMYIPSLGTDSFIKITSDWQGTCNRFVPTIKQNIYCSLFSVTDYFWVYLGVKMFSIGVVIIMLTSVVTLMYADIKRVITNHNMRFIINMNVSLRVQYYFWLFLLHGHWTG